MKGTLSPKDLAEAVGLSESSLKRWADSGLIQVTRTAGGHRRILMSEAVRYIRSSGLPIVNARALGLRELDSLDGMTLSRDLAVDQPLIDAIVAGDAERVKGLTVSAYVCGRSVSEICDGPITRAMHQVGELWQHGTSGIAVEHRANEVCVSALHHLRTLFPAPEPGAPVATGGTPPGDPYVLPSLMTATVLASEGWSDRSLGVDLPLESIGTSARDAGAKLVWLSLSVDTVAEKMADAIVNLAKELEASNARLALGGRALIGRRISAISNLAILSNMSELTAFARVLKQQVHAPAVATARVDGEPVGAFR